MATSATTLFTLSFTDVAEEAFERAGAELRTGYDLRTARRSMNLLTVEWANRGINMWTIDQESIPLVPGQATYDLPADTIDIIEHQLRENDGNVITQNDVTIQRISVSTYAAIPNKLRQARPNQIYVNRARDNPTVSLWPVPPTGSTYALNYWRLRRIEDSGAGVETPDMPFRFFSALVAGLAYYIAMKIPEGFPRLEMLLTEYEKQFKLASEEDREKATFRWVPRVAAVGKDR